MQVPAVNTPVSAGQVYGALLSTGISTTAARILLAQSAFETGGWQGGVWGYNLGNITTSGASGDYQMLPGDPDHLKYRVYPSLDAGAHDYVTFLNARGLVAIAATGDLPAYVARLKQVGYATSLQTASGYASYQNGMQAWMTRLQNVAPIGGSLLAGFAGGSWKSYLIGAGILGAAWWVARGIRGV